MAGRNSPNEKNIPNTSAGAWRNKDFVVRHLLECVGAPRPVTSESINWLLKQKLIAGNGPAQSCPRQTGLAWGGGQFQQVSDPGEDTSCEVSAHPRAMTEPLRTCRAQPLI